MRQSQALRPGGDIIARMSQLALFDAPPTVLVDDANGRIDYTPHFVDDALANAWFAWLRDEVPWRAQRRQMYDREVDVPRLTAHWPLSDPALPPPLAEAGRRVREAVDPAFNSVGLNYYRDGRDSVAPHNDHLYELTEGHPIALVSLGAPRRMTIRSKDKPRRVLDLDLEPGSLLVMSWATQHHYDHGVPKTRESVGPRISLAFRVRPKNAPRSRYAARKDVAGP